MLDFLREKISKREAQSAAALRSIDEHPWCHPFLTASNIGRFRRYSEKVWALALAQRKRAPRRLNCAFAVNMAQNMYKWAKLADKYGADATLYLNPQDETAISRPEWEEFDGHFRNPLDGSGFLLENRGIQVNVRFLNAPNDGSELWQAYHPHLSKWPKPVLAKAAGVFSPWLRQLILSDWAAVARLRDRAPTVRHRPLIELRGAYPYFRWCELLAQHDITYIASTPFPAYASGKHYCIFSVGGDLQFDCGRPDDHGRAMRAAFSQARFILVTNPHTLGHCRRLGLSNAVYLPYPMDSEHYCPGEGLARKDWAAQFGGDVFVLTTARIDRHVKGHSEELLEALITVANERPQVRFLFLGWGSDVDAFKTRLSGLGMQNRLIMLPPAGKRRLIDYYRSCDIVLDQFVYGYYGTTGLEAAAIGKPIIMKIRSEQYAPLYRGDVAPVINAATPQEVCDALLALIDAPERRSSAGTALREWLVRNHGEARAGPLMLALLQLAADGVPLPRRWSNPLLDPKSEEEAAYHAACLRPFNDSTSDAIPS